MQNLTIEENMIQSSSNNTIPIAQRIDVVCQKITPLWSLENFVAVNPYMGQIDKKFETVAQELAYISEINTTMPTEYYLDKIKNNEILIEDIQKAVESSPNSFTKNASDFLNTLSKGDFENSIVPTIGTAIEIASQVTQNDWQRQFV